MSDAVVVLRLGLPKGRMQEEVFRLLAACGLPVRADERGYRPTVGASAHYAAPGGNHRPPFVLGFEAKILKPQNIVEMLDAGSRDVGFAGADWVKELGADLVELLDTGMDPVRLVAAAPSGLLEGGRLPARGGGGRPLIVASEYEAIAREWMSRNAPEARFVRSYGATEVFPPEDADVIVDNSATGSTLRANGLVAVDEVLRSSTRLYASRQAMEDPRKRAAADSLVLILSSVLEARRRVMIDINVPADRLAILTSSLPCMRTPTVSPLQGGQAFAVRVAAPREILPSLIPEIKRLGGSDIVVTELAQLVP
jgi:ATP phosphoribosyltransferase